MTPNAAARVAGSQSEVLTVALGERSYPIVIGTGLLADLGAQLRDCLDVGRTAVVTNPTVGALYLEPALAALRTAGFDAIAIEIPDGEIYKNLTWVSHVYDRLVAARLERGSPLIALGGGVVGDLCGYVAATFLRGVPFVQVPTTLLAQVDSSVGGKTGVNHAAGKNLIGAFYQPRVVVIDLDTLRSLPHREFLAGLAEVVKYGAILDAEFFAYLEAHVEALLALDAECLRQVVRRCCELKAMVVQQDEREAGLRAILNFGHTVGHAVETLTEYRRFLHGEAVAIGMVCAARLSASCGFCAPSTVERLMALLKRTGLPVDLPPECGGPALAAAVGSDKKSAGGRVKFVCLEEIGRTRFEFITSDEIVSRAAERS